ncbi:MAG: hypothetical protein JXA91_07215 [Candidatus Thermoplasmatota archaeon]|nr:hypothetical protein [Candidatus Thermoplasmatota archaeon]
MNLSKIIAVAFISILLLHFFVSLKVEACKDIIACGNATDGDYNLLLKVRDPSRPGPQLLCIIPKGYEYTYRHPWNGNSLSFVNLHKYIGVATKNDTIPKIVKAGMTLTDAGLAFGDADTNSKWVNPTRYAWDDFDWIRYACEKANNSDQAVDLLTHDVVDKLHATGVSENLFLVGPDNGFVIEADAYRYHITEIKDGVAVMSNYPKQLWASQILQKIPISPNFYTEKITNIRKGDFVTINSIFMIHVKEVKNQSIVVGHIPFFKFTGFPNIKKINNVEIEIGAIQTVGDFCVEVLDIDGNNAKIRICNVFKAWEDEISKHISPRIGSITITDMIAWSRLHKDDLNGLRPMCQDSGRYEAVTIFKIPRNHYNLLSMGWFSPNHACTSIYVPFHICISDIYDPYEGGEAAAISLELLDFYGHSTLAGYFEKTEEVFIREMEVFENTCIDFLENKSKISTFFTTVDVEMQKQALLTEQMWINLSKISNRSIIESVSNIIGEMWESNYSLSLNAMNNSITFLKKLPETEVFIQDIESIMISIAKLQNLKFQFN